MNPENSPLESQLQQMLSVWLAANEALDAKTIGSFFADDVVYEDVGLKHTLHGQAEVERWYTDWFAAYPDFTMKLFNSLVSGNSAVMEWEFTATLEGGFHDIPESMRGKTRTVRGAIVVEFDESGKIKKERDYWNATHLSS